MRWLALVDANEPALLLGQTATHFPGSSKIKISDCHSSATESNECTRQKISSVEFKQGLCRVRRETVCSRASRHVSKQWYLINDIYIYISLYRVRVHTYIYIYIHTKKYIYIYIYICFMYVCTYARKHVRSNVIYRSCSPAHRHATKTSN